MEAAALYGGLAFVAAFCGGACLAAAGKSRARIPRAASASGASGVGRLSRLLRRGVRPLRPLGEALLGFSLVENFVEKLSGLLKEKGHTTTSLALCTVLIAALVLIVAACWVIAGSLVAGVAVALCVVALLAVRLNSLDDARAEDMRAAVPDAFRSMESCFQAGLSLMQTLQQVGKESSGALGEVFSRAAHRLEVGGSTQEALSELKEASDVPELAFAAVALDVQHQAGGSLRQVLEAARESVEGQLALRRSLRVQTAQAKLSARVVSVMPFVLLALLSLVSTGFLDPFFQSVQGMCLLAFAFLMQGAGILLVRKMLAVELD